MATLKRKATATGAGSDAKKPKADSSIMSFFGRPAAATSGVPTASAVSSAPFVVTAEPAAPKFNKEKWVAGLTQDERELLRLEIDTLDPSWLGLLKDELVTKEFMALKEFLSREAESGKKVFPPREDIYSWSRHTPFHNVKVVILGQDPYHNVNQAHGLAFSVRAPTPAPPSLQNMYKALARDYPAFHPPPRRGGLLTPWAQRGVLMLNTCLTVRAHEANSHANRGWERFTQRVIDLVSARRTRGVVFLAWGTPASKRVVKVDGKRHLVLRSVHPSPLSASRGFFDCGHFKKANEWLVQRYGDQGFIDWSLTEGESLCPGAGAETDGPKEEDDIPGAVAATAANKDMDDEFGDADIDSDLEDAVREAEAKQAVKAAARPTADAGGVDVKVVETSPPREAEAATADNAAETAENGNTAGIGTGIGNENGNENDDDDDDDDETETETEMETETEDHVPHRSPPTDDEEEDQSKDADIEAAHFSFSA